MSARTREVLTRADFARIRSAFLEAGLDRDYLGFYDIQHLHSERGLSVGEIIAAGIRHARQVGTLPADETGADR
jgi:hypothetical protein